MMTNHAESTFILASSSPRRRELLAGLGIQFSIDPSTEEESFEDGTPPGEIVKLLSLRKANSVAAKYERGFIIGADTIVVFGDEILGKPSDREDAFAMLSKLQGKEHTVFSGIAIVDAGNGGSKVSYSSTKVKMKSLSEDQINRYIDTGEPHDKAGAYAIQGYGATIIEKIDGDYFTVVGLPLSLLSDMLADFGVDVF